MARAGGADLRRMLPSWVDTGEDGEVTTPDAGPRPADDRRAGARGRPVRTALVLGALALGLAACGSSSSSTSTTSSSPPTTSTSTSSGGGSTSTTSSAPTTSTTTGTAGCATTSLSVSVGSPNGTAGATHYGLTFHNGSSAPCTLYGYPGLSFLDASGNQIGAPAQRTGGGTPTTVTLSVGGNAYASVQVTDPGIPPCTGSTAAAQIRVYPPGQTQSLQIPAPTGLLVCSSPNTGSYLSAIVTPVATSPL